MTMLALLLAALGLLGATALAVAWLGRFERTARLAGSAGTVAACALGGVAALLALLHGERSALAFPGVLPIGELHLALDPLSAFFLLCVFAVSGHSALYGAGYLAALDGAGRRTAALVAYPMLVAAMVVVVLARDAILLIVAWEILTLLSWFLVTLEHDRAEVRRAGMLYLVASQLGVGFLFVLFALLGRAAGSYDFDRFAAALPAPGLAATAFVLALVGFGSKAGFWPLHIWLPDAHPAAPSHVSALLSGVMIKMGIYGLLRTLTFLGPPPPWWGVVLIAVGCVSGVTGVLLALAQHDLKRLLAYHSVENIGIIVLGLGVGLVGWSHGQMAIAFLGLAGALLHVLNHGLFKGLLFHAAGSVALATGTREMDALGGLYRRMPRTGLLFLVGAVAICGLPPLNGFVSEWLIYVGAFRAGATLAPAWAVPAVIGLLSLALIGGLAAACFVKAFGVVFLGSARGPASGRARECGGAMQAAMLVEALLCAGIGLWPSGAVRLVSPVVGVLVGSVPGADPGPLQAIARAVALLVALAVLLALVRGALLRRRTVTAAPIWGCGYEAPSARMQYTAASFARPLLEPFAAAVTSRLEREGPEGPFPARARYQRHIGDMAGERVLMPAYHRVQRMLSGVRGLQHGRLQLYLAYILATLIALLVWQLAGGAR